MKNRLSRRLQIKTESMCYFQVSHMYMYTCVYTHTQTDTYIHFLIVKMDILPITFSSWLLLVCRETINFLGVYNINIVYSTPFLVLLAFVLVFWEDNSVSNCTFMFFA